MSNRPSAVTSSNESQLGAILKSGNRTRELRRITAPGTLEGGDVLRVGRAFYVGITSRTNGEGFEQFASIVREFGYRAIPVGVTGCLHLKSAVTALADDVLLVNPRWMGREPFAKPEPVGR